VFLGLFCCKLLTHFIRTSKFFLKAVWDFSVDCKRKGRIEPVREKLLGHSPTTKVKQKPNQTETLGPKRKHESRKVGMPTTVVVVLQSHSFYKLLWRHHLTPLNCMLQRLPPPYFTSYHSYDSCYWLVVWSV
jgi:hypothetical protein